MQQEYAPLLAQDKQAAPAISDQLRLRLQHFLAPLLQELDARLDARLVRTFLRTVEVILSFRHAQHGLLLSELGAYLHSPDHAPAGTKRLSNLLRSPRWTHALLGRFLWQGALARLQELEEGGEDPLMVWDDSVLEKPESVKSEGLGSVRSTKGARLKRFRKGFYNPPSRPITVPGMRWLSLLLLGRSGPPVVALMRWWSNRKSGCGAHRDQWRLRVALLRYCACRLGKRVLHVFDRGFASQRWLGRAGRYEIRFVLRYPPGWHLFPPLAPGEEQREAKQGADGKAGEAATPAEAPTPVEAPTPALGEGAARKGEGEAPPGKPAWRWAAGKKVWGERELRDARRRQVSRVGVLAVAVRHPAYPGPLWLVVTRSKARQTSWYLLTNEPIENAEDAWRIVLAYARRWQIELAFRYGKSELALESPRLWKWERRLKLLLMATLAYAFLLSLLREGLELLRIWLLRWFCHRTGKHCQEAVAPLYRLRTALSRLWLEWPPPVKVYAKTPG